MKELSIEEKAKLYDEAIERAKNYYSITAPVADTELIEFLFPELKESEDERIRKSLAAYFAKFKPDDMWDADFSFGDIVAWFEKQGEQKLANNVEPKFKVGDIVQYITDSTDRRKIEEVDELCNMYHTDSSPIMFEVEDEWKLSVLAEDVEHKLQVNFPQFAFDDVLALQCAMENVKKVQEDIDLYNKLLLLHNKVHDAYTITKKNKLL